MGKEDMTSHLQRDSPVNTDTLLEGEMTFYTFSRAFDVV